MADTTSSKREWWGWFWRTSQVVGAPVVLLMAMVILQKVAFTFTCYSAGFRCEYALRVDSVQYVSDLLAENPDSDVLVVPKRKK